MRLLFVCTGNILRSVIAQSAFRRFADESLGDKSGLFELESCGLEAVEGSDFHPEAVRVLKEMDIPLAADPPSPVNEEQLDGSDLVLTMTRQQCYRLANRFRDSREKYFSLLEANGIIESILDGRGIGKDDPEWAMIARNSTSQVLDSALDMAVSTLHTVDRLSQRPLAGIPLTLRELLTRFPTCFHQISGIHDPLGGPRKEIEKCAESIMREVHGLYRGLIALAVSDWHRHELPGRPVPVSP